MTPPPLTSITVSVLCFLTGVAFHWSQAQEDTPIVEETTGDWLEDYYKSPKPEEFLAQFQTWSREGVLDQDGAKPALIAFISQVIRQNRPLLADWYAAIEKLPPPHLQVFQTAMLYSRTSEADRILRAKYKQAYDQQKQETSKILEMPLDKENTSDMLWGFFYATGSEGAIRRLVHCFLFVDAPVDPENVEIPEGYMPLYKMLPAFAYESLSSNALRHPRVIEILESLHQNQASLHPREREGVYDILSRVKPETYPAQEKAQPKQ